MDRPVRETAPAATRAVIEECAARAEALRRDGADVTLVAGGELSLFAGGFLPGDDLFARLGLLTATPVSGLRSLLAGVPPALDAFFDDLVPRLRLAFGGPITYAAAPFERIDRGPFDVVAVDAYRDARNAGRYREDLRETRRHAKPVVVAEFGCCAYAGAAERGGRGWMVVDRDAEPRRLVAPLVRDEQEQVRYLHELLEIFEQDGVDGAFWFTFACYAFADHGTGGAAELSDLDLASYGLVRVLGSERGSSHPDMGWEPKAAFHALAAAYRPSPPGGSRVPPGREVRGTATDDRRGRGRPDGPDGGTEVE